MRRVAGRQAEQHADRPGILAAVALRGQEDVVDIAHEGRLREHRSPIEYTPAQREAIAGRGRLLGKYSECGSKIRWLRQRYARTRRGLHVVADRGEWLTNPQ